MVSELRIRNVVDRLLIHQIAIARILGDAPLHEREQSLVNAAQIRTRRRVENHVVGAREVAARLDEGIRYVAEELNQGQIHPGRRHDLVLQLDEVVHLE